MIHSLVPTTSFCVGEYFFKKSSFLQSRNDLLLICVLAHTINKYGLWVVDQS